MDDWKEDEEVVLKSSGMLTKNQKDEVTYALYSAIDFSVDRWIPEQAICASSSHLRPHFHSFIFRALFGHSRSASHDR